MEDRLRHGQGCSYFKAYGLIVEYDGSWKNGLRHGYGKYYYDNDRVLYDGEWFKGQRQGKGSLYLLTGECVYIGEWHKNRKHGQGTEFKLDGSKYQGSWVRGLKQGIFSKIEANGE